MATHSSILAWRIPRTEEPGGLPSMGSQSRTQLKRFSRSSRIGIETRQKLTFKREPTGKRYSDWVKCFAQGKEAGPGPAAVESDNRKQRSRNLPEEQGNRGAWEVALKRRLSPGREQTSDGGQEPHSSLQAQWGAAQGPAPPGQSTVGLPPKALQRAPGQLGPRTAPLPSAHL